MALKAKIKFKTQFPNGIANHDPKDDVIIIKVKRNNWEDFSQLLGAARDNAGSYLIDVDEARNIEIDFDTVFEANQ